MTSDRHTHTHTHTQLVSSSLLELLIAAKNAGQAMLFSRLPEIIINH